MNQNRIIPHTITESDNLWLLIQGYNTDIKTLSVVNPYINLNSLRVGQTINILPDYKIDEEECQIDFDYKSFIELNNQLRIVWEQHVTWTRLTIISIAFDLPDIDLVTKRLLQNPQDMASVFLPYYGAEKMKVLVDLSTDHLVIAADLVKAAKNGDNQAAAEAEKRWYQNADEIARFLSSINPHWSEQKWRKMLYDHLAMTKNEAVDILTNKFEAGIKEFDEIEKQALMMADFMTKGIIKQFY